MFRLASIALFFAACGGGGGSTPAATTTSLAGKYYGTYTDPDGVSREAWLQIESELDELDRFRTTLTVYPGSDRINELPNAVAVDSEAFGSSVFGTAIVEGATVLFTTPGAWSRWSLASSGLVRPTTGIGSAAGIHIDASFPQKISQFASSLGEAPTIVQHTYSAPGFTLHLQIVVPPPEKSAARLPPVPH